MNPDTPGYKQRRKSLAEALGRDDGLSKAREIPPESLTETERKRWPGGLRWFKNAHPTDGLQEEWILCEVDASGITDEAFEEVQVAPSLMHEDSSAWTVRFEVNEGSRARMAELTSIGDGNEDVRLAVIVDGEVMAAPVLRASLRRNGEIAMRDEKAARALAVAFGGRLPSKPKLILERAIER